MSDEITVSVPAEWAGTFASRAAYLAGFAAGLVVGGGDADVRAPSELWAIGYIDHTNSLELACSLDGTVRNDIMAFRVEALARRAADERNASGDWSVDFAPVRIK